MAWRITTITKQSGTTIDMCLPDSISINDPAGTEALETSDLPWEPVQTHYIGGNAYEIQSLLYIPRVWSTFQYPIIKFSQALCLRFTNSNGQKSFSYLWYENSNLLPLLWVLQPQVSEQDPAIDTPCIINSYRPSSHSDYPLVHYDPGYLFKHVSPVTVNGNSAAFESIVNQSEDTVSYSVHTYGSSTDAPPSHDHDPIVYHSPPIGPDMTWNLPTGTTIQANLQPGQSQNSYIYPTWIGINSLVPNSEDETEPIDGGETIYKHGIIFDSSGVPYLATRIPITAMEGITLRMNLVERTDGIILLGTMDLDPRLMYK